MCTYKKHWWPLHIYAKAARTNETKTDLHNIHRERNKAITLSYNLPTWASVDELHQIGHLEKVSKTIQKLNLKYLAWAIKRKEETKNIVGKHLSTWSKIKMYQTILQNILQKFKQLWMRTFRGMTWYLSWSRSKRKRIKKRLKEKNENKKQSQHSKT